MYSRNFPAESWSAYFPSDLINFFIFSQRQDKLSSICFMNMNSFPSLFFSFLLNLKLWHVFGILWKQTNHIPLLSTRAKSLENHMISCDMTCFFGLPPHSRWTSTNTDDCNLDGKKKKLHPPVPHLRSWPSGGPPFLPDKGWLVVAQSDLWHEYTPGDCG